MTSLVNWVHTCEAVAYDENWREVLKVDISILFNGVLLASCGSVLEIIKINVAAFCYYPTCLLDWPFQIMLIV